MSSRCNGCDSKVCAEMLSTVGVDSTDSGGAYWGDAVGPTQSARLTHRTVEPTTFLTVALGGHSQSCLSTSLLPEFGTFSFI